MSICTYDFIVPHSGNRLPQLKQVNAVYITYRFELSFLAGIRGFVADYLRGKSELVKVNVELAMNLSSGVVCAKDLAQGFDEQRAYSKRRLYK
jgi:hypothetical protein